MKTSITYKEGEPITLTFMAEIERMCFKNLQTSKIFDEYEEGLCPILKLTNMHYYNLPEGFPYATIPIEGKSPDDIIYLSIRNAMFIPLIGFPIRKIIKIPTVETLWYTDGRPPIDVNVDNFIMLSSEDAMKIHLYRLNANSTYGIG